MPTNSSQYPEGRRVRLPKASDVLANELRAQILEQNLQPGAALPAENELIEKYRLSRGSVREALRLLEAEGFISIQRGVRGGITVQFPNVDLVSRSLATLFAVDASPLRDLFAFRKLVEPMVAAEAARVALPAQRAHLLQITNKSASGRSGGAFHRALSDCIKNDVLRLVVAAINQVTVWHAAIEHLSATEIDEAGDAHARLAAAVADGDEAAAAEVMRRHLEAFEHVMDRAGHLEQPILSHARWVAYLRQTDPTSR